MAQTVLYKGSLKFPEATDAFHYKVVRRDDGTIYWVFYEAVSNIGMSLTNCIEEVFFFCREQLCYALKNSLVIQGSLVGQDRFLSTMVALLNSSSRGFSALTAMGIAKDLYDFTRTMFAAFTDQAVVINKLRSGQVFEYLPSSAALSVFKDSDRIMYVAIKDNGEIFWGSHLELSNWEKSYDGDQTLL